MPLRWHDPSMSSRKWLKAVLGVLIPFVLMYVLGKPILKSYQLAHPPRHKWELEESAVGRSVERVVFPTSDGLKLVGWFVHGDRDGAVIAVSHGSHANGPGTYPGVAFLNEAGHCSAHALFPEAYEARVLGFFDQALRTQAGRR